MHVISVNLPAVVACVVASMIIGSLWFGPRAFFPIWWKAIGKSEKDIPGIKGAMPVTWVLLVASSIVQAVSMALMVNALGRMMPDGPTLASGVMTGVILWIGFVAPASLTNKLFAGQLKAWALETGNHLVNFIVFGAILGAWH